MPPDHTGIINVGRGRAGSVLTRRVLRRQRDFAARHVENGDNGIYVFGIESRCYCCRVVFVNFVAWDVDGFQRIIV